ncbi:MAG: mechanosensitive ion channel family protein [Burkholderiales bacterium]|nr:mechanosensitive ion channel family protein [Burkholderiales bacterium]
MAENGMIQLGNNDVMRHFFVIFCFALLGASVFAQTAADTGVEATHSIVAPTASPVGKLVLFSRQIFGFRGSLLGVSAIDRSKRAFARIQAQLELPGPHAVSVKAGTVGLEVQINGATSFVVTTGDLDPAREETLEQAAQRAAAALTIAIRESAESRSLETLTRALALAVAGTALYGALIWLAARARAALVRQLVDLTHRHTPKLRVGGVALLQRDRMTRLVRLALTLVYRLLLLLLTLEWVTFVLLGFPYTRPWGESLNSYLLNLAIPVLTAAIASVPELLTALLIFYLAYLTIQALGQFFARVQSGALQLPWLDSDVVVPTQRISKVVVWLFALAMAYPYLPGSDTEAFKGLSVLVGLMLSLGASSLVGQAASGFILTYGRVFRKGDYVRLADHEGSVTEMGIFTTRIRTGMGEELTISNASILGATTKNYSRSMPGAGFVLDTTVTIGYDTPWRQVHAMLIEAASLTEGIARDPAPQVFQTALNDWYPVYRLVCHATPSEPRPRALLLSALHASIQDVFSTYGVQIMSPQYVEDPKEAKLVPPEKWYATPAAKPHV